MLMLRVSLYIDLDSTLRQLDTGSSCTLDKFLHCTMYVLWYTAPGSWTLHSSFPWTGTFIDNEHPHIRYEFMNVCSSARWISASHFRSQSRQRGAGCSYI